jgi:hypothetical protein
VAWWRLVAAGGGWWRLVVAGAIHFPFPSPPAEIQQALYEAGALPAFVKLLNSGNPNAELKALTALVNLSGNGTTTTPFTQAPYHTPPPPRSSPVLLHPSCF